MNELIIDSFAGGGGASTGIEIALGRSPDFAINHDPVALAMHAANHPHTRHLPHDIWKVDPGALCAGRPVGLLWASPDCKHFSKAKGGRPVDRNIRDLAWVVVHWARQVRPRVILLENVEEFATWGPLSDDGRPCLTRAGETFQAWLRDLRDLGYKVEHRELCAADYGAPTIRRRLFVVARCDGLPIVWPRPTHGRPDSIGVTADRLKPWRSAAGVIDWSLPCHSIYLSTEEGRARGVRRPLAPNTVRRIMQGVDRYVLDAADPFVVPYPGALAVSGGLLNLKGADRRGQSIAMPSPAITAGGWHVAEVRAFLIKYFGTDQDPRLRSPLHTATTKPRFGLVMVRGEAFRIVDIGMRMLTARELFRAQGFPDSYIIDQTAVGAAITKTDQIRMCGNSVCPPVAAALVSANYAAPLRLADAV